MTPFVSSDSESPDPGRSDEWRTFLAALALDEGDPRSRLGALHALGNLVTARIVPKQKLVDAATTALMPLVDRRHISSDHANLCAWLIRTLAQLKAGSQIWLEAAREIACDTSVKLSIRKRVTATMCHNEPEQGFELCRTLLEAIATGQDKRDNVIDFTVSLELCLNHLKPHAEFDRYCQCAIELCDRLLTCIPEKNTKAVIKTVRTTLASNPLQEDALYRGGLAAIQFMMSADTNNFPQLSNEDLHNLTKLCKAAPSAAQYLASRFSTRTPVVTLDVMEELSFAEERDAENIARYVQQLYGLINVLRQNHLISDILLPIVPQNLWPSLGWNSLTDMFEGSGHANTRVCNDCERLIVNTCPPDLHVQFIGNDLDPYIWKSLPQSDDYVMARRKVLEDMRQRENFRGALLLGSLANMYGSATHNLLESVFGAGMASAGIVLSAGSCRASGAAGFTNLDELSKLLGAAGATNFGVSIQGTPLRKLVLHPALGEEPERFEDRVEFVLYLHDFDDGDDQLSYTPNRFPIHRPTHDPVSSA